VHCTTWDSDLIKSLNSEFNSLIFIFGIFCELVIGKEISQHDLYSTRQLGKTCERYFW